MGRASVGWKFSTCSLLVTPIGFDDQWGFLVAFSPHIPVDFTIAAELLNI